MDRSCARHWLAPALMGVVLHFPAAALDIELSFPNGIANRADARGAMEQAAANWERTLRDPVTVRIDIFESDSEELGNAQGATTVAYDFIDYSYANFRDALIGDAISDEDALAVSHLQVGPRTTFRMWDADMNPVLMDGDEWINNFVSIPRATAKALGLPHEVAGPDAEIYWNAAYLDNGFDFDRTDGVHGTDFLAAAMHEIGHALGFTSGVSVVELVYAGVIPFPPEDLPDVAIVEPLDLFRSSAESGSYFDLTPGGNPNFSVDGGSTSLAQFASGEYFGNGGQPDHWQDGSGIMDAFLDADIIHNLSPLDRLAMDVIGWDLALTGDYNQNGIVDAADYSVWRDHLGSASSLANDDTVGVGPDDYNRWKANFGQAAGAGSSTSDSTAVPESATIVLLMFAADGWSLVQRRP